MQNKLCMLYTLTYIFALLFYQYSIERRLNCTNKVVFVIAALIFNRPLALLMFKDCNLVILKSYWQHSYFTYSLLALLMFKGCTLGTLKSYWQHSYFIISLLYLCLRVAILVSFYPIGTTPFSSSSCSTYF